MKKYTFNSLYINVKQSDLFILFNFAFLIIIENIRIELYFWRISSLDTAVITLKTLDIEIISEFSDKNS